MARAVIVPGRQALAFRRIEIGKIGFRRLASALAVCIPVDDRHGRLGENGNRGDDDLELAGEFLLREEGFVFPGDEDVADLTLHESGQRAAGARVEHRHVPVDPADEGARLGVVIAVLLQRIGIGREIVPSRAARGFRVRRDDLDARLYQIVPVLDALRIALADQENDGRGVGRGIVGQARLPVRRQQAGMGHFVDVAGQRQRHDVGLQPVDHRAGLLARAAMRLLEADRFAGFLLPVRGEGGVVVAVELAGRVVGDVEDRGLGPHFECRGQQRQRGAQQQGRTADQR